MKPVIKAALIVAGVCVTLFVVAPMAFDRWTQDLTPERAAVPAVQACAPERFAVVEHRTRREADRVIVLMTVRNDNAQACGVQMQITVRDAQGGLVATETPWIASVQDIAPGASYSGDYILDRSASAAADSVSVTTTRAQAWGRR